ncbi:unnamed protein product [Lepeophtheirus salmonis]|uniref:(salmon louse) hypothetical protein n=1 Tax=Lepeophtheirus salmonis TaxID=72036 RepID=A0A7R8CRQ5_LEPSM|nr:unnamed protein product [Lepeophtheirus salmonis]CAF2870270.1 unnamed protein product [Lepeophtheirus salmonis]
MNEYKVLINVAFKSLSSEFLLVSGTLNVNQNRDQFFIFDTANYGRIEAASETDMECKIRIPSISEQDNGDWKCIITALSEDGTPIQGNATISVTVAVPPSKMELFVDGVEAESTDLQMKLIPDDHKEIKCVALHARPAPTFTWTLNEEPLHGNIEDSEEVLENGTVNYAQTLLYYPDAKHNGVELKGLNIKLLYKPLESEKTQEFYVQSEGEAKTFNMVFEAFPEPTEVYWDLSGMESHLQQGDTSFNDKYTSSELTPGDTNGEYSISLTIEGVSVEDTKNESSLFVKNSEGETEYKFKIKLGREPAAESMGSGPVSKGGEPLEEEKDGAAFDGMEKGESVPPPPVVKPESLKTPEDKKATPEETKPLTEPLTVNEPNCGKGRDTTDEKRNFERGSSDVTYVELDKSVLSQGNRSSNTQNNSASEYAEIQHNK